MAELQKFLQLLSSEGQADVKNVLDIASNHSYSCRCSVCLAWWVAVGPEDLGDGEWSVGPFTKQEFLEAGGEAPSDEDEDEDEYEETFCDYCDEPISPENLQSNDYCWGHEEDCPNLKKQFSVDCMCDVNYHKECCPACHPEKKELRELENLRDEIKTYLSFDGLLGFEIGVSLYEKKDDSAKNLYMLTIDHPELSKVAYVAEKSHLMAILRAWYHGVSDCLRIMTFVENQKRRLNGKCY